MANIKKITINYSIGTNSDIQAGDLTFGISAVNGTTITTWQTSNEFSVEEQGDYMVAARAFGTTIIMSKIVKVAISDVPFEKFIPANTPTTILKSEHKKIVISSIMVKDHSTGIVILHPVIVDNQQSVIVETSENPITVIVN